MRASLSLAATLIGLCALGAATTACAQTSQGRQELFDLSAKRARLQLELAMTDKRLAGLESEEFADFDRVADPTGTDYWESISDTVLFATACEDIRKGELLLYHAPGIYRVKDVQPKLTTKGECWYFRPDRDIAQSDRFTIVLVYDDPEEIALQAKGFFPLTDRARDPGRPYTAEIHMPNRPRQD